MPMPHFATCRFLPHCAALRHVPRRGQKCRPGAESAVPRHRPPNLLHAASSAHCHLGLPPRTTTLKSYHSEKLPLGAEQRKPWVFVLPSTHRLPPPFAYAHGAGAWHPPATHSHLAIPHIRTRAHGGLWMPGGILSGRHPIVAPDGILGVGT